MPSAPASRARRSATAPLRRPSPGRRAALVSRSRRAEPAPSSATRVDVAGSRELARFDAGPNRGRKPRPVPRSELGGDGAQLRLADRPKPELRPAAPALRSAGGGASRIARARRSVAVLRRDRRRTARRRPPRTEWISACSSSLGNGVEKRGGRAREAPVRRRGRSGPSSIPSAAISSQAGLEDPIWLAAGARLCQVTVGRVRAMRNRMYHRLMSHRQTLSGRTTVTRRRRLRIGRALAWSPRSATVARSRSRRRRGRSRSDRVDDRAARSWRASSTSATRHGQMALATGVASGRRRRIGADRRSARRHGLAARRGGPAPEDDERVFDVHVWGVVTGPGRSGRSCSTRTRALIVSAASDFGLIGRR